MKHKNMKMKILTAIMEDNPDNYWVTLDRIANNMCWYVEEYNHTVYRICEELIEDGILTKTVVKHYDEDACAKYDAVMVKINEPILKFRNVVGA